MNDVLEYVLRGVPLEYLLRPYTTDWEYTSISNEERDYWIKRILLELDKIDKGYVPKVGEHRKEDWELGWSQKESVPKYFGKYPILRIDRQFVRVQKFDAEYKTFSLVCEYVFKNYIPKDAPVIYEFGCGTGHNLKRLRELFPSPDLYGLDWSMNAVQKTANLGFNGIVFDMFHPEPFQLNPNGVVITIAAMEQLGSNYDNFLYYLLRQKPELVIHIEPINELLDPDNLLDFLSIQYAKKRGYLDGYLDKLRHMQAYDRLSIQVAKRSYVGSLFIDGYSIIVWKPAK